MLGKRGKFSLTLLLVEALGVAIIFKVFVWVLGSKVMHSTNFNVPGLDYALTVIGVLLLLRIGYVLLKARLSKRNKDFDVEEITESVSEVEVCETCKKPVSEKVASYCKAHSKKFEGKIYCYHHQRTV